MVDEAMVVNLLRTMTREQSEITWKMGCTYTDGISDAIYEIKLFHLHQKVVAPKVISFQMGSGKLLAWGCKGISAHSADNVIDLLLDVLNAEREEAATQK